MKVIDLVNELNLEVFSGESGLDREANGGYVSDLLSDVMGHADEAQVWMTLQTHKNIMAIASLKDLAAVILVAGNKPEQDTILQSQTEGIPILGTSLPCFEIAGKMYSLLMRNADL